MTLAVPIEATVAPGQTIASALWNAGVRDAVNFAINPPRARMIQGSTATSMGNNAWNVVGFDTTAIDTYGGHSNTVNNSRYTCQLAGRYRIIGIISWGGATTSYRYVRIQVNGSPVQGSATALNPTLSYLTGMAGEATAFLNVGDYVEVAGLQATGGALSTSINSDFDSSLDVQWTASS
jgi:hypothetical protein